MTRHAGDIARGYSTAFVIVTLLVLASFVVVPGISASTVAEKFRWRADLIGAFTTFRFEAGDRVFNNAIAGKSGWIFYAGELSIPEYQRTDRFSQRDLRTLQRKLDELESFLAADGRALLLVVPPNKTTIYPQYMPDEIPVLGAVSRFDEVLRYVDDHGTTRILDLRPALIRESATQQIYYRTDTHWNELGAYYAYVEIVEALSVDFPGLGAHALSDFELRTVVGDARTDLPRSMGFLSLQDDAPVLEPRFPVHISTTTDRLPDGQEILRTTNRDEGMPTALVFGDSFYGGLRRFMELGFSRVTMLPYNSLSGASVYDWIRQEEPDIVIIECVERGLGDLFPMLENARP